MAPVQIQCPKSREVMAGLFGEKILQIPGFVGKEALRRIKAEGLGQVFEVETPTGRHRGVTVRKPFIDPDKEIPKR